MQARMQSRAERQPEARTKIAEVMRRLKRIDEPTIEAVYRRLRQEGVEGDNVDIKRALRKLHSQHVVECSHPISYIRSEDGRKSQYMRRHIITFNGASA